MFLVHGEAPSGRGGGIVSSDALALDYASVRTKDADGHLHVASSIVSAAQVNPYNGSEIPNWQALGLDPQRVYMLLRDPNELEKATPTFQGKPLLLRHRPQTADDHDRDAVIGSVINPVWETPNVKAELSVWDGAGIAAIESGEMSNLSAGYAYEPVLEDGEYGGVQYSLRMTKIRFNHLTICQEGRVTGAMVGDTAIAKQEIKMPKSVLSAKAAVAAGALTIYLKPLLAADAKIDLGPVLKGVTDANFGGRKASISAKLGEITKGKLAKDAKLDELPKVMDAIEEVDAKDEEAEDEEESEAEKAKKAAKDKRAKDKKAKDESDKEGEKRKFLENTLSEDEMASYDAMCSSAKDEEPDEKKEDDEEEKPAVDKGKKAKDKRAKDEEPEEGEEKVSKKAMDAAISAATAKATADAIATQREISAAVEDVTPVVGKLTMSFDSAEGVYKQALKMRAVDVKGVHPSAYRVIFKNLPPVTKRREGASLAMDAGNADSFKEMFPTAVDVTAA